MDIALLVVAAALLVFMLFNSRKRMAKMKEEQAAKQRQTVPGAEVMLQGGIYGTVVSYDHENLDQPAEVEIAPGVVIKVHSQAVLRVIDPVELEGEQFDESDIPAIENIDTPLADADSSAGVETIEETRRRLDNNG